MKKFHYYFLLYLIASFFTLPLLASAAWWNPLSWINSQANNSETANIKKLSATENYIETVKSGDSVLKLVTKQLENYYEDKLINFNEAQETYITDTIKHKIINYPKRFGLTDPDQLKIGQKIDFSYIFKNNSEINSILKSAVQLSQKDIKNITENNQVLRIWIKENPDKKLTSEEAVKILENVKNDMDNAKNLTAAYLNINKNSTSTILTNASTTQIISTTTDETPPEKTAATNPAITSENSDILTENDVSSEEDTTSAADETPSDTIASTAETLSPPTPTPTPTPTVLTLSTITSSSTISSPMPTSTPPILSTTITSTSHTTTTTATTAVTVADTAPPIRSNGIPTGTLPFSTSSTTISLLTNEKATCKYTNTSGTLYDLMANTFSTTGNTTQATLITGLKSNTSFTYYIRCKDIAGNANLDDYPISFSVAAPPPDITPPTISNISINNIASSTATIIWTTNEPADSQVEYGKTTAYGSTTELNSNLLTSHTVALSRLLKDTKYHYRVKSKDAAGNLTISNDQTFETTK